MKEKQKRLYKGILWALIVLTVGAIWSLSLRSAVNSSEQSNSLALSVIGSTVESVNNSESTSADASSTKIFLDEWLVLIRKLAHFAEFAVLGLLWGLYGQLQWYPAMWTYGLGVALIDEGLQMFIPGRAAAVRDVVMDYAGFFCGFALVMSVARWIEWKKSRKPGK